MILSRMKKIKKIPCEQAKRTLLPIAEPLGKMEWILLMFNFKGDFKLYFIHYIKKHFAIFDKSYLIAFTKKIFNKIKSNYIPR